MTIKQIIKVNLMKGNAKDYRIKMNKFGGAWLINKANGQFVKINTQNGLIVK